MDTLNKIVIGGNFGENPKISSIVKKLATSLNAKSLNGGSYKDLQNIAKEIPFYDIVVWMPNIDNKYEEVPFTKKIGSTLIVSKAIRDNTRGRGDAVARIFKYQGNGVIQIQYGEKFEFTLIDALNNDWAKSFNIDEISQGIINISNWTKEAKREGTLRKKDALDKFIAINKSVSNNVIEIQGRFFGNLSTRCAALFPSQRKDGSYLVSGRNTDKRQIKRTDMVECFLENEKIRYLGERKPSVDTPVQINIYEELPNINYMIHGHNFLEDVPSTHHYYPCGDKREIPEIIELIKGTSCGAINLKNHGFLLYAQTLEELENIANNIKIKEI